MGGGGAYGDGTGLSGLRLVVADGARTAAARSVIIRTKWRDEELSLSCLTRAGLTCPGKPGGLTQTLLTSPYMYMCMHMCMHVVCVLDVTC